jgi:hypothetical protein
VFVRPDCEARFARKSGPTEFTNPTPLRLGTPEADQNMAGGRARQLEHLHRVEQNRCDIRLAM